MAERSGFFQVSLMNVFRQAAQDRDARASSESIAEDGGKVLSVRSIERREGASQVTLRSHLAQDLSSLLGTICLDAALPLDGLDHVKVSILNYGMQDMSRLTADNFRDAKLARDLRAALLAHEPRLIAETLEVTLRSVAANEEQRITFDISAEMTAKPVDVPLEFVAEIDTAAGKINLGQLTVRA